MHTLARPQAILLSNAALEPELISEVLNDQGGPRWDRTSFRLLGGLDLLATARGEPAGGEGTVVAIASTGWWVRPLDMLADALSLRAERPVLAVYEVPELDAWGYHLARPGQTPRRDLGFSYGDQSLYGAWAPALAELAGGEAQADELVPLHELVDLVVGDESFTPGQVSLFAFQPMGHDGVERQLLMQLRVYSLVSGLRWREGAKEVDTATPIPEQMHVFVLRGPVRLPGPPRWTLARSAASVAMAQKVIEESNGWICLVPQVDDHQGEVYGAAVQVLQVAQLPTGTWGGVIHPRVPVKVSQVRGSWGDIQVVERGPITDEAAYEAALDRLVDGLKLHPDAIRFNEATVRGADEPELEVAWQVTVDEARSQEYFALSDPVARLELLASVLEAGGGHGPQF